MAIIAVAAMEKNAESSSRMASARRCAHKGTLAIAQIVSIPRRRGQYRGLRTPEHGDGRHKAGAPAWRRGEEASVAGRGRIGSREGRVRACPREQVWSG